MIKGVKRKGKEYDGKFDPEMGIFLGSFSSIFQTPRDSSTRFNISGSTSELKSLLNNKFESAKAELSESLLNTYLKIDKLNLLSEIAIEIKSLERLMVNNQIDESYSQEDCKCLKEVFEKMKDFIEGQKQIFESTNQSDYPIPYYMIPDKEASSFEKPLHYFEYLFNRNGITHLRNNFIQYYSSDDYANSTYNTENETVTHNHYDIETGEWSETYSDFKAVLNKKLKAEYIISKNFIDEYIDKQKEEADVVLFIKRTLGKLNSLLSKIADGAEALKYKDSQKPIDALIKHIHNYHSLFVPQEMITKPIQKETKGNSKSSPPKKLSSFKWIAENNLILTILLLDELKATGFVNKNTELANFHKAFNGSELKAPLQIEWIAKGKNGSSNKISLLHLINSLTDAKLIIDDLNNADWLKTIERIFCDSNKNQFKHLKNSNSNSHKNETKTEQKKEIDVIIYKLKQLNVSK